VALTWLNSTDRDLNFDPHNYQEINKPLYVS